MANRLECRGRFRQEGLGAAVCLGTEDSTASSRDRKGLAGHVQVFGTVEVF